MSIVSPKSSERKYEPYPEYKDSGVEWLGEVPAHWEIKPLKRVLKVFNGSTPRSSEPEYWDGDIPWVTPEDLGGLASVEINEPKRYITQAGYESCGTKLVPAESLILSTRAPIGHLAIAAIALCTNQGCRSLVPYSNMLSRFSYYVLYASHQELISLGQGSTFMELGKSKLETVALPFPQIDEQQAIAEFLDQETARIDELIARKQRLIDMLQEQRMALITHAVTKGIKPGVPIKDSGVEWLGEIPACWEVKRLKYIIREKITDGPHLTPEFIDEGVPFLSVDSIQDGELNFDSCRYVSILDHNAFIAKACPEKGDILLGKAASTGKIAQVKVDLEFSIWSPLALIKPNKSIINSTYLEYSLKSIFLQSQIDILCTHNTQNNISMDDIPTLLLLFPPIDEQQAIADYLDQETARIDSLVSRINQAIEKLQEYRSALITATVTGKIDVRQHVS